MLAGRLGKIKINKKSLKDLKEIMKEEKLTLKQVLIKYDQNSDQFDEHEVQDAVVHLKTQITQNGEEPSEEIIAESMAFGFCEDYNHDDSGWGTYFGPMFVLPNDQGQMMESPSIQFVTKEILLYWEKRAKEASHPILKARYADLVWDFSRKLREITPSVEMVRIVIDATIEIARKNLHRFKNDTIKKLGRALSLALSINDTPRVGTVSDTIIGYEDFVAEDSKCGLWGFAFEQLIENNKVTLSDSQRNKIIKDLEERLDRVSDYNMKDQFEPFAAESAAIPLARYYRKLGQSIDFKRVLLKYGTAFMSLSEEASPLIVTSWLQGVYTTYMQFGLREEADQVAVKLRECGAKSKDEMKTISHEMTISKEELSDYCEAMTEGDIKEALFRIATQFLPSREESENQLTKISRKSPLQFYMTKRIQDHKGRVVAEIGPLLEDMNGHVVFQISQNMGISSFFLREVIEVFLSKFNPTPEDILDQLYCSPVFDPDKKSLINRGLASYIDKDYLVSIHLLIPQIEDTLRNLVEKTGGAIYKPARNGGFFLKTMDEVLRDQRVSQSLGADASLYLRILFTDQRGWNLRNSVCHGICSADTFSAQNADRVFHALILIGQLRESNGADNEQAG